MQAPRADGRGSRAHTRGVGTEFIANLTAITAIGGSREQADREVYRGEIEVLSETPGLHHRRTIVEYVIHPDLIL